MTRLQRLWLRWICRRLDTCQVDWLHDRLTGHRRCEHCHQPIKPVTVGELYPDSGD